MDNVARRTYQTRGSPAEAGLILGRALGDRLDGVIRAYLEGMVGPTGSPDREKLGSGAMAWLQGLPERFREEYEGMARGAGLPVQRIAEWGYSERFAPGGCSALVCVTGGQPWVARNNDTETSGPWGYVTVSEIEDRIPTIGFSLEGDIFAPAGMNQERLWLSYNHLPADDAPSPDRKALDCFVFLMEALETCGTIREVEDLLGRVHRVGGMSLLAVDGKGGEFAVFECAPSRHARREVRGDGIVAANHHCALQGPAPGGQHLPGSEDRHRRMEELLADLLRTRAVLEFPGDLVRILADDGVERRSPDFETTSANVACPGNREIWYTFGGTPAASAGDWQPVKWSW